MGSGFEYNDFFLMECAELIAVFLFYMDCPKYSAEEYVFFLIITVS